MRKIESLLEEYAVSHQTTFNKKIHYVCVPLIFFSIIGLLASIPVPNSITNLFPKQLISYINFGTLIVLFGLMYYLRLSFILFLGMLFFSILVLLGINLIVKADLLPLWSIMLIIFVLSWIAQFIGHNHEGKKPSFLKDIQFLMIGPAWTLSHLFDAFKIKF
ncbi:MULTISPECIES: Mpo1 family 2-hydroxy fatty acid dioxygenase [Tenacibaculum]|uniref:Mpo1 family 2-hydroxy fatty acid dioxygenase n=1 Tax=Tenacibaculum TaxID=104267 RepID=UPI000DE8DBDC|nr:Mpo1-like protein [Tenacibaculum sp. E3R01]RBW56510.1 hypothetical protein DS884_13670 [Tenacibaculum sp. E3R01]